MVNKQRPPAKTPEGRQNQLISLAVDEAERQIREGTASSQIIVHFLKLGTQQAKLETEKLQRENELLRVKAESIEATGQLKDIYEQAINAMKQYTGEENNYGEEY